MLPEAASTGISLMGDMPWGTHFCYFFETRQDLLDASIPFFQAGLEHHEFCLWIVCAPLNEADAIRALRESIPGMDRYLDEGGMEILVHGQPITPGDGRAARGRVHHLHQKLAHALARGYAGMRVAGSPASMQKKDLGVFREFERELGESVANRRMIALCQFPLANSSAAEILDAARTHQFVVSRRQGDWEIIETPEIKLTKAEIAQLNRQLERRVEERAHALEAANQELRSEIARRERVEEDLRRQKEILQTVFDHIPIMLCFFDENNRIKLVNPEWERTLGCLLEEIPNQDMGFVVAQHYPDPEYRRQVVDFAHTANGEWVDLKTKVRDGRVIDTSWAVVRISGGTSIAIGEDITRRKQAEQDLRRQKEILQTIFDHLPIMISFIDRNGEFKLVNREWERTLGRSLQEIRSQNIDIVGENYPDPDLRQEVEDFYRGSHGEWHDFKTRVPDGRVIDVSWAVLHLSDGTAVCFGQDITRRKRADEALRESEERFRQLAETIRDLFWIKTPDLKRVIYFSPSYDSISGRSREDAYRNPNHQGFLKRVAAEDRERMTAFMERTVEKEYEIEYRITHPDGSLHWVSERGYPIRDPSGQIYRVAGITHDITAAKLAEEALRESEERFRQIAENIHEVFWLRSPDSRQLLYVSPMYEKVFGRTCESLYADGENLSAVHPDDRPRVLQSMQTWDGSEFEIEYRIISHNGQVRWIRDRGFPIRNQSGEIYRMGGVAEDVTYRKEAEERLKTSSEQLRALSASLQSTREKEATRIARQIHDELGGPLAGLRWELEALEKMIHQPADPERVKMMQVKLAAMVGLTDATINVVRRVASELRPSILDDLGLLEAIEWQTQQFEARTGIECRCDCSLPRIPLGDQQSTAVFRIVQEALTNILRHAQATRVVVAMKEEDGIFVLTVADNGRGISQAEVLSRASLGLLGMQERAHLIGGRVDIVGLKGRGTTLHIRVPLAVGEPRAK
jgi:PAS domain S-box-containing protein